MDWRHGQALGGGKPSGHADRLSVDVQRGALGLHCFRGRRGHRTFVAACTNARRAVFSRLAAAAALAGPQ